MLLLQPHLYRSRVGTMLGTDYANAFLILSWDVFESNPQLRPSQLALQDVSCVSRGCASFCSVHHTLQQPFSCCSRSGKPTPWRGSLSRLHSAGDLRGWWCDTLHGAFLFHTLLRNLWPPRPYMSGIPPLDLSSQTLNLYCLTRSNRHDLLASQVRPFDLVCWTRLHPSSFHHPSFSENLLPSVRWVSVLPISQQILLQAG